MVAWSSKKLGELCAIELGRTPARDNPRYWDTARSSGHVWLSIADLLRAEDRVVSDSKEYISDAGASVGKRVRKGTLLVSFKLTLGRLAIAGKDLFTNEAIAALTFLRPGELSQEFLYYSLLYFDWNKATEGDLKIKGRTLNKAKLAQIEIAFPDRSEQRRIVAVLDEAFEHLAIAKANAEKNLLNATELFEQHHASMFSPAVGKAVTKRLGDFASFRNGVNYTKQSKGHTVPIIGVKDFQNHFWAPLDDLDCVTLDGDLCAADTVVEGDIVTVRSNGNPELIGRCMVVGKTSQAITHSGFTIKISLDRAVALPTYICQFMRSRVVRRELIDGGNGLNIRSLSQQMLAEISVPLPTIESQRAVAAEIEAMSVETTRLADLLSRKLAALDELKKSLLHQAFTGALHTKAVGKQVAEIT